MSKEIEPAKLPEWALHAAAQCWCEPTTSMIEMDPRLAAAFAERLAAERERCADWLESEGRHDMAFGIRRGMHCTPNVGAKRALPAGETNER